VKNLATKEEQTVPEADLIAAVRRLLDLATPGSEATPGG
jgi:hypothetical protein